MEGQNIAIDYRSAEGKEDRLPGLAAELVRLKVDVIVTSSRPATAAARQATRTIPIVFTVSGNPVADGSVASLARPGGNTTGLATLGPELVESSWSCSKRSPRTSPGWPFSRTRATPHPRPCGRRRARPWPSGCSFKSWMRALLRGIEAAFAAMRTQRADGVLLLRDALFRTQRAQIAALAAKGRLPVVYGLKEHAEAGGLMAYGANVPQMYRRAATYVTRYSRAPSPPTFPSSSPPDSSW